MKAFLVSILSLSLFITACGGCASTPEVVKIERTAAPASKPSISLQDILSGPPVKLDVDYDPEAPHKVGLVRFDKGVNNASAEALIAWIAAADRDGLEALVIEIDSPGGSVDAGNRIIKKIENAKTPIYCLVDGDAASMALAILQSCPNRLMTKRSVLMAHNPSVGMDGGQEQDMDNARELLQALSAALAEQYCHRLTISLDACRAKFDQKGEWWFGYSEALKVGAIDSVSPPAKGLLAALRADMELP